MRALVVVAAGSGERLAAGRPKALVELAGRPLVGHALDRLAPGVDRVVVVAPPGHVDEVAALARPYDAVVVPGGASRTASVLAGTAVLPVDADTVVAIHDAARALTPAVVLERAYAAVTGDVVAAGPVLPVVDTLKQVDRDRLVGTVERTGLGAVQTPQVVRADVLAAVHAGATSRTDDLGLVEEAVAAGLVDGRVAAVAGSVLAAKVTHPTDLVLLAALLAHETELLASEADRHDAESGARR